MLAFAPLIPNPSPLGEGLGVRAFHSFHFFPSFSSSSPPLSLLCPLCLLPPFPFSLPVLPFPRTSSCSFLSSSLQHEHFRTPASPPSSLCILVSWIPVSFPSLPCPPSNTSISIGLPPKLRNLILQPLLILCNVSRVLISMLSAIVVPWLMLRSLRRQKP